MAAVDPLTHFTIAHRGTSTLTYKRGIERCLENVREILNPPMISVDMATCALRHSSHQLERTHSVLHRDPSVLGNCSGQKAAGAMIVPHPSRASAAHRAAPIEWKSTRGVAREFCAARPLHNR